MDKNKFINSLKKSVLRVMPGGQALSALAGRRTQTPQALPMQNTQKNIAPNIPATNFNTPKVQNSPMVNRTNSSNTPVSNSGVGSSQSNPKTDYMNNVYKPMATGAGMTTPTTTTGSVDAKPVKKEQSAYIEYLKSMFNPEQVKMAQKNIFDLNERIAKENKRVTWTCFR